MEGGKKINFKTIKSWRHREMRTWHQGWVQIGVASLESNLADSEIKDAYSLYPEILSLCIELAKILAQFRNLYA